MFQAQTQIDALARAAEALAEAIQGTAERKDRQGATPPMRFPATVGIVARGVPRE